MWWFFCGGDDMLRSLLSAQECKYLKNDIFKFGNVLCWFKYEIRSCIGFEIEKIILDCQ